jgi:hypothetical protein
VFQQTEVNCIVFFMFVGTSGLSVSPYTFNYLTLCRAMTQTVSRRPVTSKACVRSPIPVAARSRAWVYGRSLTGIVGSNPAGGLDVCVVFVV